MPIDHWLSALPQNGHSFVAGDLEALGARPHPFLSNQCAANQIERLSGHLGDLNLEVRRQVIGYSLYVRQVDVIMEAGPRAMCASRCPRPPCGCCNADHFVTLSTVDLMSAQRSPLSLHMGHVIGLLQKSETAHSLDQGRSLRSGHCRCLAEDGCTLRLFKSPRCAHYLCDEAGQDIEDRSAGHATAFLAAMKSTAVGTISCPGDFTNPGVLAEAAALFAPLLA